MWRYLNHQWLQFIHETLDSPTDVWMFRQRFINQLAVVSFMNYVMHMANRLPHTIAFARDSGNVVLSDLYMSMCSDSLLDLNALI